MLPRSRGHLAQRRDGIALGAAYGGQQFVGEIALARGRLAREAEMSVLTLAVGCGVLHPLPPTHHVVDWIDLTEDFWAEPSADPACSEAMSGLRLP